MTYISVKKYKEAEQTIDLFYKQQNEKFNTKLKEHYTKLLLKDGFIQGRNEYGGLYFEKHFFYKENYLSYKQIITRNEIRIYMYPFKSKIEHFTEHRLREKRHIENTELKKYLAEFISKNFRSKQQKEKSAKIFHKEFAIHNKTSSFSLPEIDFTKYKL